MAGKAKTSPTLSKSLADQPRIGADNLLGYLMRSFGLDEIEPSNLPVTPASQGGPKPRLGDDQLTQYDVQMRVLTSEWTPDQAEAWAKRLGFLRSRGSRIPPHTMRARRLGWTLPMSLIWIVYRDMNEVREGMPEYMIAHKDWGPTGVRVGGCISRT